MKLCPSCDQQKQSLINKHYSFHCALQGVQVPTDAAAQDVAAFSVYDSSEEMAKLGLKGFSGEEGYGNLERRWVLRPDTRALSGRCSSELGC